MESEPNSENINEFNEKLPCGQGGLSIEILKSIVKSKNLPKSINSQIH